MLRNRMATTANIPIIISGWLTYIRSRAATINVLMIICLMYFITYVDRVNIGTAAESIRIDLNLTVTQLGIVFSAFAYPYAFF
jgi:sugar phosphate permease